MSADNSYRAAGVDIDAADAAKRDMAAALQPADPRILTGVGPFATLIDASFAELQQPVIVLKTEEPGTKQKLAAAHGAHESICYDLVHHLIDDIVVMGAQPIAVQDAIICGALEPAVVTAMVRALAAACRAQGCSLTGGETSEQPGVLAAGTYIMTASVLGVVERARVIDGSAIVAGDMVLALAANGVHTNGYSLIRRLLDAQPELAERRLEGERLIDVLLRPHRCYLPALRPVLAAQAAHGLAHITGGGMRDNLQRIVPAGCRVEVDLGAVRVLDVFRVIREAGDLSDDEMLRVFNLGVGLVAVAAADQVAAIRAAATAAGVDCYPVGTVRAHDAGATPAGPAAAPADGTGGKGSVTFTGQLAW